ncbi:transcription factor atf1 [Cladorrhinum sp. PSN332]|nr:transcription factor atf1 [Cladorrhinum sp. PSN332]
MGSSTRAAGRGESKSPKQTTTATTTKQSPPDSQSDVKHDGPSLRLEPPSSSNAAEATTKPLAPPPRPQPQQQQGASNSPNYFSNPVAGSLSLEPNPFEQSFGSGAAPETPGGTKLPSVAALTSPSSLLPGTGQTPYGWGGGGLRNGPLSPAMLSGPTTDYFADTHHIRGSFPTPNESSLRTGLTPGGSGSMFPVPSPNTQALFQISGGAATPSTIEFQRTALAAAAKREQVQSQAPPLAPTSQPQELGNGVVSLKHPEQIKPPTNSYEAHDNEAANGLFMLAQGAQGRNGTQPPVPAYTSVPPAQVHAHPIQPPAPAVQPINTSPHMNGGREVRSVSEAMSAQSDDSELAQQNTRTTRAKGKRGSTSAAAGTRRKAEDAPAKAPANKKAKANGNGNSHSAGSVAGNSYDEMDQSDEDDDDHHNHKEGGSRSKMTDEEKRKNFLERNRVAALKCRQRKKQWLQNLQNKVEIFSSENDALSQQITQLREEVVNLKTLLLAHKDCPVTQQQGLHGAFSMQQQPMEPYNPQMAPYGIMPAPMAGQPVANGGSRRFS